MRESNGNTEVVAPSSAPMLQIVPFPVALIDSAPGPKYSMILLVPPLTVRRVQRKVMMSFGAAHADREHPEAAAVGRVGVGADHEPAGEGVVLEDDLVDDPGARLPEADPVFPRGRAEEVVDLLVLADRASQVVRAAALGTDQMVAVERGGDRHALAPRMHELQ